MSQALQGFVFDLTNPFAGQVKSLSYILQRHGVVNANSKIQFDNFFLPFGQGGQGAFDFVGQGFLHQ